MKVPFFVFGPDDKERKKRPGRWYLVWRTEGWLTHRTQVHEKDLRDRDEKILKTRTH